MNTLFKALPRQRPIQSHEIFLPDGRLRVEVFMRAFARVDPKSTPGYPYMHISTNAQLDLVDLYRETNKLLSMWRTVDKPTDTITAINSGYAMPAHVFVKSEPTKMEKKARLIYGTSIIMNVIGRILFGDYLDSIVRMWDVAAHKVGLDFNTDDGLKRFLSFYRKLYKDTHGLLVSDDVQGWEYQSREWMHAIFHEALRYHMDVQLMWLYEAYEHAEKMQAFVTSDGDINIPPFFIMLSGKILTHFENSMERAALALMDAYLAGNITLDELKNSTLTLTSTNGDDCLGPVGNLEPAQLYSSLLGFVHTDIIACTEDFFVTCSQIFRVTAGKLGRCPDSTAKSLYNLLATNDAGACMDIMHYLETHQAYPLICTMFMRMKKGLLSHVQDMANESKENKRSRTEGC